MISQDADGWQVPVGLTAAEAICIDDSDSDHGEANGCQGIIQEPTPKSVSSVSTSEHAMQMSSADVTISANTEKEDKAANQKLDQTTDTETEQIKDNKESIGIDETQTDANPFACFAFNPICNEQSDTNSSLKKIHHNPPKIRKISFQTAPFPLKRSKLLCGTSNKREPKKDPSCSQPEEIGEECTAKWHSFAVSTDPIELQRFHILIAARLHARCQEGTVRKAMDRLRSFFEGRDGLNPVSLSKTNHEEIAPLLSSVLFGNTKAKQLVQAAQDVVRMGGEVPETSDKLQRITGIGPKLAYILCRVNTRATFLTTREHDICKK